MLPILTSLPETISKRLALAVTFLDRTSAGVSHSCLTPVGFMDNHALGKQTPEWFIKIKMAGDFHGPCEKT